MTSKEKVNICEAIKNCNISKLEKYIDKNGLTLNMWSIMFYMPLVETLKILINNNATIEIIKSEINNIKEKRNNITKLIKSNNIEDLENYIMVNNISLKELKNEDFDILINSIENEASIGMIKYIIKKYQYNTFNYFTNTKSMLLDNGDTPLYYAISKNNFSLANLLLDYGSNINYDEGKILCHLAEDNFLNKKNLLYVLNHKFELKYIDRFIIFLIQNHTNGDNILSDSLKIIFNYYNFDNIFVLNLLSFYKNKKILSDKQLKEMIIEEKYKIYIKEEWYKEAIKQEHYKGINTVNVLLDIETREKKIILKKIEEYYVEIL